MLDYKLCKKLKDNGFKVSNKYSKNICSHTSEYDERRDKGFFWRYDFEEHMENCKEKIKQPDSIEILLRIEQLLKWKSTPPDETLAKIYLWIKNNK